MEIRKLISLKIIMKVFTTALKVITGVISSILIFVFLFIFVLNIIKFAIFSEYYSLEEDVCLNPGLNQGLVPQGIAVSEDEDLILTCGYMVDGSASRIYITNTKNKTSYVKLYKNEKEFDGHVGGIALEGDNVYIANGTTIYKLSLTELLAAKGYIDIGSGSSTKFADFKHNASFAYAHGDYLYIGEFHDGDKYVTDNKIEMNGITNSSICSVFHKDDLTKPVKIYSLPNKVQGFCITDEGTIVLSTSYGLTNSKYYIYETSDIKEHSEDYFGIPVYFLGEPTNLVSGPAMAEDLSYADGKVYCLTESACDKYIFGKFFFANSIYMLDI